MPLQELLTELAGKRASAAYAARLLGAPGTAGCWNRCEPAGTDHSRVVAGTQHRWRTVILGEQDEGTLEDTWYKAFLQVAGWFG